MARGAGERPVAEDAVSTAETTRRLRLRGRVFGGATVVAVASALCVAVVGLIAWNVMLSRSTAERATSQAAENLAGLASREVESGIAAADAFLRGLTAVLPPNGPVGLSASQYAVLAALAGEAVYIDSAAIFDPAGRPLHVIAEQPATVVWRETGAASASWFAEALRRPDHVVVGPPVGGVEGARAVLPVARALSGPGGVRAVAVVAIPVESLQRSLAGLDIGSDGVVWLLWGGDIIVFRRPSIATHGDTGRVVRGGPYAGLLAESTQGTFRAVSTVDGVARLYAFRALGDLPLILAVGVVDGELVAAWWRQAIASLAMAALLCAALLGAAVLLRRESARRNAAEEDLWQLSETDPLTGLANRRRFERVFDAEVRRRRRNQTPLSLLMIDVDWFKLVNDRFGHARGDSVLQAVAEQLLAVTRRPGDVVARVGGDEFAVILPETDARGAISVAEAVRARVEGAVSRDRGGTTITVGVATATGAAGMSAPDVIAAADRALYAAKEAGRNRVVQASDLPR